MTQTECKTVVTLPHTHARTHTHTTGTSASSTGDGEANCVLTGPGRCPQSLLPPGRPLYALSQPPSTAKTAGILIRQVDFLMTAVRQMTVSAPCPAMNDRFRTCRLIVNPQCMMVRIPPRAVLYSVEKGVIVEFAFALPNTHVYITTTKISPKVR